MNVYYYVAAYTKSTGEWLGWLSWNDEYLTFTGDAASDPSGVDGSIPIAIAGQYVYTPRAGAHAAGYLGGYGDNGYYVGFHDTQGGGYTITGSDGGKFSIKDGGVLKDTNGKGRYLSLYESKGIHYSSWEDTDGQAVMLKFAMRCLTGSDWMSGLDAATTLDRLSVPGTHDSCAVHDGGTAGYTQCQWLTIPQQLEQGIRFLDLRCKFESDDQPGLYFPIHHGAVYQEITFAKVQTQCLEFLSEHPDEFILVNIQQEVSKESDAKFSGKFTELADAGEWYVPSPPKVPSVGDCRGKLVLVRSNWAFPGVNKGLPWLGWEDNAKHGIDSNAIFVTQNNWQWANGSEKGPLVEQYILDASTQAAGPGAKMYLNFLSYSLFAQTPGNNAAGMNPRIQNYIRTTVAANAPVGILPMDFSSNTGGPGSGCLEDEIIRQNSFKAGFKYY